MASSRVAKVSGYQREQIPFPFSPFLVNEAPRREDAGLPGAVEHQGAKSLLHHAAHSTLRSNDPDPF